MNRGGERLDDLLGLAGVTDDRLSLTLQALGGANVRGTVRSDDGGWDIARWGDPSVQRRNYDRSRPQGPQLQKGTQW